MGLIHALLISKNAIIISSSRLLPCIVEKNEMHGDDAYEALYQNFEMCGLWIRVQSGQFGNMLKFQNNSVFQKMLENITDGNIGTKRNNRTFFSLYIGILKSQLAIQDSVMLVRTINNVDLPGSRFKMVQQLFRNLSSVYGDQAEVV